MVESLSGSRETLCTSGGDSIGNSSINCAGTTSSSGFGTPNVNESILARCSGCGGSSASLRSRSASGRSDCGALTSGADGGGSGGIAIADGINAVALSDGKCSGGSCDGPGSGSVAMVVVSGANADSPLRGRPRRLERRVPFARYHRGLMSSVGARWSGREGGVVQADEWQRGQ